MGRLRDDLESMNEAAMERFIEQAQALARSREFKDPGKAFARVRDIVSEKLEALKESKAGMIEFVEWVDGKFGEGIIGAEVHEAELLHARLVLDLIDCLDLVFEKACERGEAEPEKEIIYGLSCVGVGVDILSAHKARKFGYKPGYSTNEDDIRVYIDQKLADARSVHKRVVRGLDGTHELLGIAVPELAIG